MDIVLEIEWAYGAGGTQLAGKFLMSAISTGGLTEAYQTGGHNRFSIIDFLTPFNQTAHLCGMGWLKPFVIHSGRRMEPAALSGKVEAYRELLVDLRDGRKDPLKHLVEGYTLPKTFKTKEKSNAS
jgi:glutathione-regulated potassium-efflux system ancillary protein KefG